MKLEDLKYQRRYRLVRDVENSLIDRRATDDVRRLAWCAGDVFRAERSDTEGGSFFFTGVRLTASRYRPTMSIFKSHPDWPALIEALEELPETVDDVLHAEHISYETLMTFFIEQCHFTPDDIRAVCRDIQLQRQERAAAMRETKS